MKLGQAQRISRFIDAGICWQILWFSSWRKSWKERIKHEKSSKSWYRTILMKVGKIKELGRVLTTETHAGFLISVLVTWNDINRHSSYHGLVINMREISQVRIPKSKRMFRSQPSESWNNSECTNSERHRIQIQSLDEKSLLHPYQPSL